MKRPTDIWTIEVFVAVWISVPTVKIVDQMKMDCFRPKRSAVNACPRAPLKNAKFNIVWVRREESYVHKGTGG
jgi:hypothetical protein